MWNKIEILYVEKYKVFQLI